MLVKYLLIILFSATPILEQRAGIPYGFFVANLNPLTVAVVSYIGSFLPVPFILLLFNIIFNKMLKFKFLEGFSKFVDKKVRKGTKKVLKYKKLGLILFVAIPLPTTGLWTGSAVAAFLGIEFKKAMLYIALGGVISAVLITGLCYLFPALVSVPQLLKKW